MCTQEPALFLKLSNPQTFHCSACKGGYRGDFGADGWVVDLVEAWQNHIDRYHPNSKTSEASRREWFIGG